MQLEHSLIYVFAFWKDDVLAQNTKQEELGARGAVTRIPRMYVMSRFDVKHVSRLRFKELDI
jgi:hypothetical protein